jgi:hypothetical protein
MHRRRWLLKRVLATPWLAAIAASASTSFRGRLATGPKPVLAIAGDGGKRVPLSGDEPTMGVLRDDRLRDADVELIGSLEGESGFRVDPIHTRAMFVHKDGKRLLITYWCDVCYIRTYTPGICWCCQKDTDLDLRESISD